MLRGASAEARGELAARLDAADAAVGEELFGVAGVLRQQAALRRVVTDASIEPDAKAGLAGDVFGSVVGSATLGVVQDAVRRRWTSPRDLADVLEFLGVLALVRSAQGSTEGGGGRISDELFQVRRLIDSEPDLRSALSDPARSVQDKSGLLHRLLDGKVQAATLLLVQQAMGGAHGGTDRALEEFQDIAAEAADEKVAVVRSARDLGEAERDRLSAALSRQYDTTVHLQVVVDPGVIGGLRVEIGDDVIDGTVSGKLEDAQRKLAG